MLIEKMISRLFDQLSFLILVEVAFSFENFIIFIPRHVQLKCQIPIESDYFSEETDWSVDLAVISYNASTSLIIHFLCTIQKWVVREIFPTFIKWRCSDVDCIAVSEKAERLKLWSRIIIFNTHQSSRLILYSCEQLGNQRTLRWCVPWISIDWNIRTVWPLLAVVSTIKGINGSLRKYVA